MAKFLNNSATSGDRFNGRLFHVGDGSEPPGTDWVPDANHYPQDGTIDLVVTGDGTRYIDTQWTPPSSSEWVMSGIYNVVTGVSYDMYSIHYKGNNTADIYLGDESTSLVLSESDKAYTPPVTPWEIYETPPDIIIPTVSIIDSIYVNFGGSAHTGLTGVTYNDIYDGSDQVTSVALVTINNDATDATMRMDTAWVYANNGNPAGDDSGCVSDYELSKKIQMENTEGRVEIWLPSGTYDVKVSASSSFEDSDNNTVDFLLNGITKTIECNPSAVPAYCQTWSVVSTGANYTLTANIATGGYWVYLGGIRITQTA